MLQFADSFQKLRLLLFQTLTPILCSLSLFLHPVLKDNDFFFHRFQMCFHPEYFPVTALFYFGLSLNFFQNLSPIPRFFPRFTFILPLLAAFCTPLTLLIISGTAYYLLPPVLTLRSFPLDQTLILPAPLQAFALLLFPLSQFSLTAV